MVNFASIAQKKVADIERPPNMPIGTYRWVVSQIPIQAEGAGGNGETLDCMLKCLGPTEDGDLAAIKE